MGVALRADVSDVLVGLCPQNLVIRAAGSPISADMREGLGVVVYDYLSTPTGERIVVETKGH